MTENAWLIEQDSPARGSVWFTAVGPEWRFSSSANDGLRFARKVDAETFIKWLGGNPLLSNPRATEHVWMGAATDWSEYEDEIADAIQDSVDMDWTSRDGAKAVVRFLNAIATPLTSERAEVAAIPSRDVIAAVINAWDDTLNLGGLVYEDIEARLCKDPRIISSTGQHTGKL